MAASLSILIVEDHHDLRDAMTDALEIQGHQVIALRNAEEVSESIAAVRIDVAIIDLNLPGEDGIGLTKRLRQSYPFLGIVIVTARGLINEKTLGYESGADIYLTKPVALQELNAVVHSLGQRMRRQGSAGQLTYTIQYRMLTSPTGLSIQLSSLETIVLKALIMAPGKQLQYWQLMEAMGKSPDNYSKSALELIVVRLRKRLVTVGLNGQTIMAVRNEGYQLTGSFEIL